MTVQVDKTVYFHIFVGNVGTTKLSGRFVDVHNPDIVGK